jgi:uncharacterized protein
MITVAMLLHPPAQLVLMGDKERDLWRTAHSAYVPALDILWQGADLADEHRELTPLLEGKTAIGGRPTAYLCRNFVCDMPTTNPSDLRRSLANLSSANAEATTP